MKICALIPVYNNRGTIADIVERCRAVIERNVSTYSQPFPR